MKYLITGEGGREHAIALKISQSSEVTHIFCMPGNAGTASISKCSNLDVMPINKLLDWALTEGIDRLIVGSENLLVQGIVDKFNAKGIQAFGPHQAAAMLEGSKSLAKDFMHKYQVRTAQHRTFQDYVQVTDYLGQATYPLVIKADGLASGKGVFICQHKEEALQTATKIMKDKIFGDSGNTLVIEQYLSGFETSILAFYDGNTIVPMLSAKDHKKIFDGEQGKNTGGMGVIAPNPLFTEAHNKDFIEHILLPTQHGLAQEKLQYKGALFFGLMIQNNKCYLLEYNTRFGDPEMQTLLVLLENDLHTVFSLCLGGDLSANHFKWSSGYACCVVLASGGYPDAYQTGYGISIDKEVNSKIFAAGASKKKSLDATSDWQTSGGRVINAIAKADTLEQARIQVYNDITHIHFEQMYYRKDIGLV